MNKALALYLASIMLWAYEHDIEVLVYKIKVHGGEYPKIRFTRENESIEEALLQVADLGPRAEQLWRKVGLALCVKPPVFFEVQNG